MYLYVVLSIVAVILTAIGVRAFLRHRAEVQRQKEEAHRLAVEEYNRRQEKLRQAREEFRRKRREAGLSEEPDSPLMALGKFVAIAALGYAAYKAERAIEQTLTNIFSETTPSSSSSPKAEPSPEQLARLSANQALHEKLTAGLDTSHDWYFSGGQEFYTLYEGGFTFQHYNRKSAEKFGWSQMTLSEGRAQIDHYDNDSEMIGWTNDKGERNNMKTDRISGDLVWHLYKQYIRPFQMYERDKQ